MKRLLVTLFIICLCLTGCGNSNNNLVGGESAVWDYKEYSNIDDMNTAVGTNIVSAAIAGKADEKFGVISGNIAQYTFVANGEEWCIRASKNVDSDISGLYYDSIDFEKDLDATYYNDEVYASRFFNNDIQYVISLNVKDKDISTYHFDQVCGELKTNITGVKSGYDVEVVEDGDNVINRTTIYNDDGTSIILEVIYSFKDDKMVSIINNNIFESDEAAKDYYDLLIENGRSADDLLLNGNTISSDMSSNIDFYSDYTKQQFIDQLKSQY